MSLMLCRCTTIRCPIKIGSIKARPPILPGEEYYTTLHKTLRMEELVGNHSRIIKQFAGGRKIGLSVDEWGIWYDVESGTNPDFLYQQNTMRDALVAAVNLNIFNNHCDTVCMTNIA